jgi:hypothetical protein
VNGPECDAEGCPRTAYRYCGAHHHRVRRYGDPLAHVPIGANYLVLREAAAELSRTEVERVAMAPAPAVGRGFLWLV